MKKLLCIFSAISMSLMSFAQVDSFTTSGTYTVPPNVFSINVELVGAGGKGGSNGGGGGGGGGYSFGTFSVTPGQSIPFTVAQTAGQVTSISSLGIQATSGSNGGGGSTSLGGNGGVGSGGTFNRTGGNGGNGTYTYFGGGGGGAAGSSGNGQIGGNTVAWTGNCQIPGGVGGTDGGYPGGAGGKGAGFTDLNCNVTSSSVAGGSYGGGGGGGNGNGGPLANGASGIIKISLAGSPVQSVKVSIQGGLPPVINTNAGTLQAIATVLPTTANQAVSWSIIPLTGDATINGSGLITATANGTVWARAISVQDLTKRDSVQVVISNQVIDITSLTVATQNNIPAIINVPAGTLQMTSTILPSTANQNVTWSIVSATGNALINTAGLVTAIANGTVWAKAISVQDASKTDSLLITISNQPSNAITDVIVSTQNNVPPIIDVNGGTLQLVSSVIPSIANQSVVWTIVPVTGSASVNTMGLVTAMTNGTVWGKAVSVANPNFSDSVLITISNQGVGIKDLSLSLIELFPNPAKEQITILSGLDLQNASFELLDIQGRVIYSEKHTQLVQGQSKTINIKELGSGIYFFKIKHNAYSRIIKVVKE